MEQQVPWLLRAPTLSARLLNSQQISLDQSDVPNLRFCYRCPALETLHIGTATPSRDHELQTLVDTDTLIHYMGQPSMRTMILWDMHVVLYDDRSHSKYPPIEELNSLGRLSSLELRQVNINADALVKLFCTCTDLRAFTLTRPSSNRGALLLDELANVLRNVSSSLTSLTLGYHSVHKSPEITLLPSLRNMKALLHLKIDPSMYLGRHLCPYRLPNHPVVVTRPASSFADLLPDGLQTLTLDIDIEQVMRLPDYRRDIITSIINARAHLPNLAEITLFEDEAAWATATSLYSCGQCYRQGRIWRGNPGKRSVGEAQERREFVKQMRRTEVKLFRDIGDGAGRYECTAWGSA
ncbi:hypothetical protein A1O7_06604 [Cladophialophora yegresii CBS 114405]|uniref:F-box domain-containing protein n=1 Tax=Cladophialophora yegresii CBS 114405 TaxID=1182544 RepID=W9VTV0_9EURO|nr:uncharacterized protein A1O7_06604 [Cladophialophora yegresii CBS 114405]EXJ59172.1 hypothetical protein A1O7_06604 [Cladophialophora yegresii CBS 114405]